MRSIRMEQKNVLASVENSLSFLLSFRIYLHVGQNCLPALIAGLDCRPCRL